MKKLALVSLLGLLGNYGYAMDSKIVLEHEELNQEMMAYLSNTLRYKVTLQPTESLYNVLSNLCGKSFLEKMEIAGKLRNCQITLYTLLDAIERLFTSKHSGEMSKKAIFRSIVANSPDNEVEEILDLLDTHDIPGYRD